MNEDYKRVKRFFKDIVKKLLTRQYYISPKHLFDDKRYYIIRRNAPWAGFFANYLYVAAHMGYALRKGWIPVVDMQNYPTLYNEEGVFNGTLNAWEYYFEQPMDVDLEVARNSRNYIISDISTMHEYLPYSEGRNKLEIDWKKGAMLSEHIKKYIRVRPVIMKDVNEFIRLNFAGQKVLGVHYRGTDKKIKVKDHYIAANLEAYIDSVKQCINENPVERILLCTDEKAAIDRFEQEFQDMVFYSSSFRAEESDMEGIHLKTDVNRPNHRYLLGLEVLCDMLYLSRCEYFVFSHSNVANAALFVNNQQYVRTYLVRE